MRGIALGMAMAIWCFGAELASAARAPAVPDAVLKAMKERQVRVEKKDGTVVEGQLVGVEKKSITVLKDDGVVAVIARAEIVEVRGRTKPEPPKETPQPGAAPVPVVETPPAKDAAPPTKDATPQPEPPKGPEPAPPAAKPEAPPAVEAPPPEPRTATKTEVGLDGNKGAGVSITKQTITEVTQPVGQAHLFTWSVTYVGTFGDASFQGGGGQAGYRYLDPQGDFPGPDGGSKHCFDLRLNAAAFGGSLSSGYGDFAQSSTSGSLQPTGGLGYTYLKFHPREGENLSQTGWGINLGLTGGVNVVFGQNGTTTPVIAPLLGIEFPKINPGTAQFSSWNITALVVPIPSSFVVSASVGGSL